MSFYSYKNIHNRNIKKMGFEKTEHSEFKNENNIKTEIELTEHTNRAENSPEREPHDPKSGTLTSLGTLLDDIQSPKEEWPKEALRRVLTRFGRMPRTGWSLALAVFCGRFKVRMTLPEFKKKASHVLTSQSGKRCTAREFKKESTKRVKSLDTVFDEKSLYEAKIFNDVKTVYLKCIQEGANIDVDKAERTRKVPEEKVNHLVLDALSRVVGESVQLKPPTNMSEIAKAIQAAQQTYQLSAAKYREKSNWRESIEKKIQKWKSLIILLERVKKLEKLNSGDKGRVKVFMDQERLKMGNARDATEAISYLNERIIVFSKKIEMHEKRKLFSKTNNSFELYRRRFYRNLSEGEEKVENNVPEADIKAFWLSMWNEKPEPIETAILEQYLPMHIAEMEPQNVFPTFEEFQQIIRFLPNWKAAGPDGVFNFFIKKLEALHQPIYEVVRRICLE